MKHLFRQDGPHLSADTAAMRRDAAHSVCCLLEEDTNRTILWENVLLFSFITSLLVCEAFLRYGSR
jgi:hypothetical protein